MKPMPPAISLRPPQPADADALIAANRLSADLHAPWVSPPIDLPGFDAWLTAHNQPAHQSLIAWRGPDIIGVFNFSQIAYGNFCSAYLGFYANAGFTGQGLMTIALTQAAQHAFTALGLHRLEANIQPENEKSRALVQRAGFTREGFSPRYLRINNQWRDHERWAVLAQD